MIRRFLVIWIIMLAGHTIAQDDLPLYDLPDSLNYQAYSSNSLVALAGGQVAMVNTLTDSVSIVDVRERQVITEIAVQADPRQIDVTPDGTRLLVTNRATDTLSIIDLESQQLYDVHAVGSQPYGVITSNNETAFVSLQGDDAVAEINILTGQIVQWIPTPPEPTGLALWGDFLYVTHFHTGELSLIYLPVGEVVRTISTGQHSGLSQFVLVDYRNGLAYLPQSVTYPDSSTRTFDRTVRPRVIVVDLAQMRVLPDRTIWLDIADRPVNMPFSVALNVAQGRLFVLNSGSDDLSVIELNRGLARWHTTLSGNPRGILLSNDATNLYIQSNIEPALSLIETRFYSVTDTIPTSSQTRLLDTQIGATLFHSANDMRVSGTPYLSCASCHFDGASDGRIWADVITPVLSNVPTEDRLNQHIALYTFGYGFDETSTYEMTALRQFLQKLAVSP